MARRMEVLPAPLAHVTSRERPFLTCILPDVSTICLSSQPVCIRVLLRWISIQLQDRRLAPLVPVTRRERSFLTCTHYICQQQTRALRWLAGWTSCRLHLPLSPAGSVLS